MSPTDSFAAALLAVDLRLTHESVATPLCLKFSHIEQIITLSKPHRSAHAVPLSPYGSHDLQV
jgi:hypothetical protein